MRSSCFVVGEAAVTLLVAVALAGLAVVSTSCKAQEVPPSVILVVLDTLRVDHLSTYGYHRPTSPNLDRFAVSATRYMQAYATAPWTLPVHASLFTGKFPFEHGAHDIPSEPGAPDNVAPLADVEWTLAEELRLHGYFTLAIGANAGYLDPRYGLAQGFDVYDMEHVPGDVINWKVDQWLAKREDLPVFLFVNFMETHRPYDVRIRTDQSWPNHPDLDPHMLLDQFYDQVMGDARPADPALRQKVVDQYDTAVRNADNAFAGLLAVLRSRKLADTSLIVVTSDHGEYFGEHRLVEHSKDIYQAALHVPLLIHHPRQSEAAISNTPFSSVDVPGLILDDLRLPPTAAAKHLTRRPGTHPILSENYFSRVKDLRNPKWGARFCRVRAAIFDGRYKLIVSSDGRDELFNLRSDPGEDENLIEIERAHAERLAKDLSSFIGSTPPVPRFAAETCTATETDSALGPGAPSSAK